MRYVNIMIFKKNVDGYSSIIYVIKYFIFNYEIVQRSVLNIISVPTEEMSTYLHMRILYFDIPTFFLKYIYNDYFGVLLLSFATQ